jgi:excisionase family DNA binding protein
MREENEQMLSIEQAAGRLNLKPVTLRAWIAARRIGCVRLGRRVVIPENEIERLIERGFVPPSPERAR